MQTQRIPGRLVDRPAREAGEAGYDTLAPDGSRIRLLPALTGGSMVHCSLPPGQVSNPVRHRTVEEIWYVLRGSGELWRKCSDSASGDVVPMVPGTALDVPLGTHFQFRNTGADWLEMVIVTMPPWPGEDEAVPVPGFWVTWEREKRSEKRVKTDWSIDPNGLGSGGGTR